MIHNLASIYLGLLALGMGFAAINQKGAVLPVFLSGAACIGALLGQLLQLRRLVTLRDWAAVEDTVGAIVFAAVFLTLLTVLLNTIALLRRERSE